MYETTNDAMEGLGLSDLGGFGGASEDGRIGTVPATGAEYARRASSNFEVRRDVIDPSEGANYSGGGSYAPGLPLMPSSIGLAGLAEMKNGKDVLVEDLFRYDYNMAGLDEIIFSPNDDLALLPSEHVKPWPPLTQDESDLFEPTVSVQQNGMAALEGNAFFGKPSLDKKTTAMRKVMEAALRPGTREAGNVAKALARQSVSLAGMARKRTQAYYTARRERKRLMPKIVHLERVAHAKRTTARTLEDKRDALRKMELAKALGKRAVRYAKVEAIADRMARNAAAQANVSQMIATSVLAGQPAVAATLGKFYTKMGEQSAQMRGIRKRQIVKSTKAQDAETLNALLRRKASLLGQIARLRVQLSRCSVPERPFLNKKRQEFSRELASINKQISQVCARNPRLGVGTGLSGLEDFEAWKYKPVRTEAMKRKKRLWLMTAIKERGWKIDPKVLGATWGKWFDDPAVARKLGRKLTKAEIRMVWNPPAPKAVIKHEIKQHRKRQDAYLMKPVKAITKPIGDAVKAVGNVAKKLFVDWPCQLATSTVGKMTTQIAAGVAGGTFGGPAGGAAGAVIANRMNDVNKSLCKGLKDITRGKNVVKTLGRTATRIGKSATNPKHLLRDAQSAGMAYMGGGGAADIFNKFGGGDIAKLGLDKTVGSFGTKALSNVGGPGIDQFVQRAGGKLGTAVLNEGKRQLTTAANKFVAQQAGKLARPILGRQGARLVQSSVPALMRGRVPGVPTGRQVRGFVQKQLPAAVAAIARLSPKQKQDLVKLHGMLQAAKRRGPPRLPSRIPRIPTRMPVRRPLRRPMPRPPALRRLGPGMFR